MTDCFLGDALGFLSCQFLEYCSAVWCSAVDTHVKLLDLAVSGTRFLTGGMFECDIAHRRSVAVLCMLFKIRCNPVHPLNSAIQMDHICQCGLHAMLIGTLIGTRTSVHLCTASLQNLAVQPDFYSSLGVPLERSC